MNAKPNAGPGSDLERRLAARLQPARVPGAEQTWAQVAPHLGQPGGRPLWVTLATAASVLVLIAVSAAFANALIFPRGTATTEENAGGYGSALGTPAPAVNQAGVPSGVGVVGQGNQVISIAPPPPFTVFQPGTLPEGMKMLAQSYRSAPPPSGQQVPTAATAGAAAAGPMTDPTTAQAAARWSQELLGSGPEATLVLIYGATADNLIGLVQRTAADKVLPAGEPIAVRALPGSLVRADGRTTVTWIERDTYLELVVSTRPDELPLIATIAAGLIEATLAPPSPVLASAVAQPVQPRDPTAGGQAVAVATGGGAPGSPGTVPATANDPVTSVQGTASFDRAAIAQRCGAWDASLHTASLEQIGCYAMSIIGSSGKEGYSYDRATWAEASARLGTDPTIGPADDRTVWLITFGTGNAIVNQVILDAETGDPLLIIGHTSQP